VSLQFLGPPGPGVFAQTTYNFRDTATLVTGNHSIKIGADLYWEQDADSNAGAARPTYSFRNIWSLGNDAPYQEAGNFDPKTGQPSAATKYIRSSIYAGFVQDDYRVLPNLTLNLGLRYEYFQPVREKYGNISNVVLGSGPNPLTGLTLRVGGDLYNASKLNFGPQIGFAWRPNPASQRFVVRGGFGIGYNRMQEAITLQGKANPPLITGFTLTGTNVVYALPNNINQFAGYPANPNARQTFNPNTNLPVGGAPISLTGFPSFVPTPYTYRYSLDTQYDLGGNWTAKLGYQGSSSRRYTRQNNLNFLYGPSNPIIQNLYYYTNDTNGNYNALLAEIEHRFAKSFQIDAQYRWSKTIDEGSNDIFIGEYPYGLQYLRGPADFDVRHLFKLYGEFSPRLFKDNSWKEKIFGGWQVTGILSAHTGFPWTPTYSNTGCNVVYPNSSYCNLRPSAYLGGAGTDYSNDTFRKPNGNFPNGALAYFTVPTFPASGIPPAPSVGRNVLQGPNFLNVDTTLTKAFGMPSFGIFGEAARFEFRANFFNIFNKTNLSPMTANSVDQVISTDGRTSNPLFGQPQSALGGRTVEFQARFSF
jgi:TonB dependent receptor